MNTFDVSIIIPVYNVAPYVQECLNSVSDQSAGVKIECLIVDDCGTDNSIEIANRFIRKYSGPISFRILKREHNGGLSAARNSGIKQAQGKYIYLLDSDDRISSNCIEKLYGCALKYPDAEIITGDFQTFPTPDIHKTLSLAGKNFPEHSTDIEWIRSVLLSSFPITAWNKLITRDFILRNDLYFREGIIHEDNHWHALAYPYLRSVAFVFNVTYYYRMRQGSITMSEGVERKRFENMSIIYTEMFSRNMDQWDYPWMKWMIFAMFSFRFPNEKFIDDRKRMYVKLNKLIKQNKSIPFLIRLAFKYLTIPQPIMRIGTFWALINLHFGIFKTRCAL